jgi:hypothetical protein
MTQLDELLTAYGRLIEADLQQVYGLNIADVWRADSTLSARRALNLVEQLKYTPDSRFRAAALGSLEFVGWGPQEVISSQIHDRINDNSVITVKAQGGKVKRPPEPYPIPTSTAKGPLTSDDIDDFPLGAVLALTSR